MPKTRRLPTCAGVVLVAGIAGLAGNAEAGLTIDLRLPGGSKVIDATGAIFGKIPIDIYAIVTGTGSLPEGFQSAQGAILTYGDNNMAGRILPAGDLDSGTETTVLPARAPFNNLGSTPGGQKHVAAPGRSADTMMDLGDVSARADLGELVVFRAGNMQLSSGATIPNGREYRIGTVEVDLTALQYPESTYLNWFFRTLPDGSPVDEAVLFRQDGVDYTGLTGSYSAGSPVNLFVFPEPGAAGLGVVGAVALLHRRRPR